MNNYSSDEEKQISWFQENYKNILLGIILGLGFGFSYNYYNDMQSIPSLNYHQNTKKQ